eukprot:15467829-Alexandrium_andersonii.AAC.1
MSASVVSACALEGYSNRLRHALPRIPQVLGQRCLMLGRRQPAHVAFWWLGLAVRAVAVARGSGGCASPFGRSSLMGLLTRVQAAACAGQVATEMLKLLGPVAEIRGG